jgi:hypothetical protein
VGVPALEQAPGGLDGGRVLAPLAAEKPLEVQQAALEILHGVECLRPLFRDLQLAEGPVAQEPQRTGNIDGVGASADVIRDQR